MHSRTDPIVHLPKCTAEPTLLCICPEAKPLCTDVTGILVLQGVHVDAAFSLSLARLKGLVDDVKLLLLDKTLPVLVYLLADNVIVHSHLVIPKFMLALMFILVGQAARDVADLLGLQPVDEPNVQQDTGARPAAGIAVGLLQPVVLLECTAEPTLLCTFSVVSLFGNTIFCIFANRN